MNNDKMRAEFEAWAESQDCITHRGKGGSYWHPDVRKVWRVWQAAYQAGRIAVQREKEEWSKRVNKRWIEMENKLEGER